ncbi:MAG: hypothetical protein WC270_00225 [Patescibacteria group bacterium]|jgi:hypothetical protein
MKEFFKRNWARIKVGMALTAALIILAIFLGHVTLLLGVVGVGWAGAYVYLLFKSKSPFVGKLVVLTIVALVWFAAVVPFTDQWLGVHMPQTLYVLQMLIPQADTRIAQSGYAGGVAQDVQLINFAKFIDQVDASELSDSLELYKVKRTRQGWSHEDTLAVNSLLARIANSKKTSERIAKGLAISSAPMPQDDASSMINLDVTDNDPLVITVPANFMLVMRVETANYMADFNTETRKELWCDADGYQASPNFIGSPRANDYPAPDLNFYALIYKAEFGGWQPLGMQAKPTVINDSNHSIKVEITLNDVRNGFGGNKGIVKIKTETRSMGSSYASI